MFVAVHKLREFRAWWGVRRDVALPRNMHIQMHRCVCVCADDTLWLLLVSRPVAGGNRRSWRPTPLSCPYHRAKTAISQLVALPGSPTAVALDLLSAASQTLCCLLRLCLLRSLLFSFSNFLSLEHFLSHNLFIWK